MRRVVCAAALVPVLCAGCTGETDRAPDAARPPRAIVLVTVDGLISADLALFGGSRETPAIAELARSGSAWASAWTTVPMTRPAVATYLTGMAPDHHRVTDDLFTALPADVPTLATELTAAGYRTAAFPDSSFLGPSSGLLRGFEATADTPPIPVQPWRWLPYTRPSGDLMSEFEIWLATLANGTKYFSWLHFSQPLNDAFAEFAHHPSLPARAKAKRVPESKIVGLANVDQAVGQIVQALRARGDLESALLIVAGTQGDPRGGDDEAPGAGLSLADRAIHVPVVLHLPDGRKAGRGASEAVWAPDVAATIAAAAGVRLGDGAEGISLADAVPADRVLLAWTWATRDQLGLAPARVGGSGSAIVHEGPGIAGPAPAADPVAVERIAGMLRSRSWPAPPEIPLDRAREILAARGLTFAPRLESDAALDGPSRRRVAEILVAARYLLKTNQRLPAMGALQAAFELAPDAPAVRLDWGHFLVLIASPEHGDAVQVLRRGVELYATNPEMLHWYAHAIWRESWKDAEKVLVDILPYKPEEGDVLYDLACTRSLAGDLDASVGYLRRAIEAGFRTWAVMETDTDLRALRESGRFAEVLKEYRK